MRPEGTPSRAAPEVTIRGITQAEGSGPSFWQVASRLDCAIDLALSPEQGYSTVRGATALGYQPRG